MGSRALLRARVRTALKVIYGGDERLAAAELGANLKAVLHGRRTPSPRALAALAGKLGVPLGWLTGADDELPGHPGEPLWLVLLTRHLDATTRKARLWLMDVCGRHPYGPSQQLIDAVEQEARLRQTVLRCFAELLRKRHRTIPERYCSFFRREMDAMARTLLRAVGELEVEMGRGEVVEREKPFPDEYYLAEWDYQQRVPRR